MAMFTMTYPDADERRLRDLLNRYGCPVPFHAARARLLGAIASPAGRGSLREALIALWGDEPPAFATAADAGDEIDILLDSLRRSLEHHCATGEPVRLVEIEADATREELAHMALVRREEIDGFVAGLFGEFDSVALTQPAHVALDSMADIRGLLQHLRNFLDDPAKTASPAGIAASLKSVHELTQPLEEAMNRVINQCRPVMNRRGTHHNAAPRSTRILH